ncbi:hypothetical protein [Nostoc sp.]
MQRSGCTPLENPQGSDRKALGLLRSPRNDKPRFPLEAGNEIYV